jgi:CheY-like chemotaxis protein
VLTGKSSLETAVAALRHGAFDYLTKPCKLVELESLLSRVAEKRELTNKYRALKRQLERIEGRKANWSAQPPCSACGKLIAKVAPDQLDRADPGRNRHRQGTGRPGVHEQSLRADKPFVAVNCGALPESADRERTVRPPQGRLHRRRRAPRGPVRGGHGGTIFLDEIGELPKSRCRPSCCACWKAARSAAWATTNRVHVDVRVVCATHRNLEEMVEDGDFREDLMYRINTFEIHLPPLRERIDDIPELAEHLYRRFRPALRTTSCSRPRRSSGCKSHVLAGQRPRTGQRDRARHDPVRRAADPPEHLPASFASRGVRDARTRGRCRCATWKCRPSTSPGPPRRQQAVAAEELGVSLKTLYNKLNHVERPRWNPWGRRPCLGSDLPAGSRRARSPAGVERPHRPRPRGAWFSRGNQNKWLRTVEPRRLQESTSPQTTRRGSYA